MGTWGTGIYEDDMACDVRDAYQEMAEQGFSCKKSTGKIIKRYKSDLKKFPETVNLFWLALAKAQMESGVLDDRVRDKAIEMIDEGIDLQNWQELGADPETLEERKTVLEQFRAEIKSFG